MKKCLYILLAIFLLPWVSRAQDTVAINKLADSASHLQLSNPVSARLLAQQAVDDARKIKYLPGEAHGLGTLGLICMEQGYSDQALIYLQQSLKLKQQLGNIRGMAKIYNSMGQAYEKLGSYTQALGYYIKALDIRVKNNYLDDLPVSYNNIGYIYELTNDNKRALDYYQRCVQAYHHTRDSSNVFSIYNNIGSVYRTLGKGDSALLFFNRALAGYLQLHDSMNIPGAYNNIAIMQRDKGQYTQAIALYKKGLAIARPSGNTESEIELLANMGDAYSLLRQYKPSLVYYTQAYALAKEIKSPALIRDIALSISQIYDSTGNYAKAYPYYKQYATINDSLMSEAKSRQIVEMQTKYETEKKESRIKLLENEKRNTEEIARSRQVKLQIITGALLVIFVLSVFLVINYRKRILAAALLAQRTEEMNRRRITDLLKEQELKSISAMVEGQEQERRRIAEDLHDRLGSLLSTVKLHFGAAAHEARTGVGQPTEQYHKAQHLLDEACQEVRKIAHNMISGVLVKFGLVPALHDLADSVQESGHVKVKVLVYGMDERLENTTEIQLYRMAQELVSNILKHASAREITIQLTRQDSQLVLLVEDDGQGFDMSAMQYREGMGVKNVSSRAAKLGGAFTLDSRPGRGTTAIIEIPVVYA